MIHLDVGSASEARIVSELIKAGWKVCVAWNQNIRYDLVGDYKGKLYRIQCKTAWRVGGNITFNVNSSNSRIKGKSYAKEADLFGVYSPDTDKVYLVPVPKNKNVSTRSLRLTKPKNNVKKNIHWARDFEL